MGIAERLNYDHHCDDRAVVVTIGTSPPAGAQARIAPLHLGHEGQS